MDEQHSRPRCTNDTRSKMEKRSWSALSSLSSVEVLRHGACNAGEHQGISRTFSFFPRKTPSESVAVRARCTTLSSWGGVSGRRG